MKFKRYLVEILSHLLIIWSVMLLTFWVTDRFNTAMAFINHSMTKGLLFGFALVNLVIVGGLMADRKSPLSALRMGVGILSGLLTAGMIVLLGLELAKPELLLFVNDLCKGYLLGFVLCGLFGSVLGIVCRRRRYFAEFAEASSKKAAMVTDPAPDFEKGC